MSTGMCRAMVLPPLEQPYLSLGYTASSTNQHRYYVLQIRCQHWLWDALGDNSLWMDSGCWIPQRWEYHIFQTNGNYHVIE